MNCFVQFTVFLQFLEGKVGDIDYEFGCEFPKESQQNKGTYFIVDLDSLLLDHKDHQQQQQYKNQKTNNILAGILYSGYPLVAEQVRAFILNAIKTNIYYKLKQYQEGFRNIIIAINDYTKSSDSQNYGNSIVINLCMKIDSNIYLSNSIEPIKNIIKPILNEWKILRQDEKQFREINKIEELKSEDQYFYMINEQYTPLIKEIILTSDKCSTYNKYEENLRKKYPLQYSLKSNNYFLRLKNINL